MSLKLKTRDDEHLPLFIFRYLFTPPVQFTFLAARLAAFLSAAHILLVLHREILLLLALVVLVLISIK